MVARAELILGLRGNLGQGLQQVQRQFQQTSSIGQRSMAVLARTSTATFRQLDRLGNRYVALATGAGAVGAGRSVMSHQERLTMLGITAQASAEQIEKLNQAIYQVAQQPFIRVNPSEILSAVESILEKTGDLKFAQDNLQNIGMAIRGTGASGAAIGELMGEFQKLGTVDPKGVLELLDILNNQGKAGAFTLQNLASLGPRVITAYAGSVKGLRDNATVVREMGAALQAIRMGTGSSEQAATAFERLLGELQDAQKQKLFRKLGIELFEVGQNGQKGLRPVNELLLEMFEKTKGDRMVLGSFFGDEAIRSFGDKGLERISEFMAVQGDGKQTMQDSARAAGTAAAAMTNLATAWKQFADTNLAPYIQDLADFLNSVGPDTVQNWLKTAQQIALVVGGIIAARKLIQVASWGAGKFGGAGGGIIGEAAGALGGGSFPVPVYVVNKSLSMLPGSYGAGASTAGGAAAGAAAGKLGTLARWGGGIGLAAAGGAAIGYGTYKLGMEDNRSGEIAGAAVARVLALFGNEEAKAAIERQREGAKREAAEVQGTIRLEVDDKGRLRVGSAQTNQPGLNIDTYSGRRGDPS